MYSADGVTPSDPFVFTGSEKMNFVDLALVKANVSAFNPSKFSPFVSGNDVNTNVSGTFYAVSEGDYYFDSTWVAKSIPSEYRNLSITGYEFFNNFGQPASLGGSSIMDYDALATQGVTFGYKPNILKSGVVSLSGSAAITEINRKGINFPFKNATYNAYAGGGYITSQNTVTYESTITNASNAFINSYAGFTDSSSYVTVIPIANVRTGLSDSRYGDLNAQHEYISTGTKYTFTPSEISTLQAGGSITIASLDVWGGDCLVGPQTFKVSDSTYAITNRVKSTGTADTESILVKRWGLIYKNSAGAGICQPIALENVSQYVELILESEYSEVRDKDTIFYTSGAIPIYRPSTKESLRTPLSYRYNTNLSQQNDYKISVPKPTYSFEQTEYAARLVYSDLKIYNSDQAGFDIIRVGNAYDLEESRRGITKLALASDNLYAIQERGVTYIPTGERQLEATDAGQLAVRSGEVIGRPLVIDDTRGSQHIKGIVETGQVIYIPDNLNKNVYRLSGQELEPITKDNETQFRDFFGNFIDEKDVISIYDPIRNQYWLVDKSTDRCEIFNEKVGWIGQHEFTGLMAGISSNQTLYLLGRPSSSVRLYTMYTGTPGVLFDETVVPRVTFLTSSERHRDFSKTFDNIQINTTNTLGTVSYETGDAIGPVQTATDFSIDTDLNPEWLRERTIRTYIPRADGTDARMRGIVLTTTVKWKEAVQSAMQTFWIKYRPSLRNPF
jgi:hypothetical protein